MQDRRQEGHTERVGEREKGRVREHQGGRSVLILMDDILSQTKRKSTIKRDETKMKRATAEKRELR